MGAIAAAIWSAPADASEWYRWHWREAFQPCQGDCALMAFAGITVETRMEPIFFKGIPPWSWDYGKGGIAGATASRRIVTFFDILDVEAEVGFGQRFGDMHEAEFWGAVFVRYSYFPWNNWLYTTIAASTGLNYATGISPYEKLVAGPKQPGGSNLMHYFAPEVTFALPDHKDRQLVIRMHHRSGGYGIVSSAYSGAQYLTVGLRCWF